MKKETVKLSTLEKDAIVLVKGHSVVSTVSEILDDIDSYRGKEIYTTTPYYAGFDAKSIIETAIEQVYQDDMYEDWDELIAGDVTNEDIEEIQAVFDRLLERSPSQNIAHREDKLIEFDI